VYYVFYLRLLNNFKCDENAFTSNRDLMSKYEQEKENLPLEEFELGRIVKEVFPDVNRVQKRVNGKPTWHYNLAEIPASSELFCASSSAPLSSDKIEWFNLPQEISPIGWQLTSSNDEFNEWIKVDTQDLCNGNRVLHEIKIFKNWNYIAHGNNKELCKETIGISDLRASR